MARRQTSRKKPAAKQHYARTARLNSLLQQIVADYFDRSEDGEFGFMTVTGVEVDNDLNVAEVFVSSFDVDPDTDPQAGEALLEKLDDEHRKPIKRAIADQAQLRKTPNVVFKFDHGVQAGSRVEEILRTLGTSDSPIQDLEELDGPPA
jgi:ribosome-binding factor A